MRGLGENQSDRDQSGTHDTEVLPVDEQQHNAPENT